MEFDPSFFFTIISAIGSVIGVIWWIRRLWWQRYERIAVNQDQKMGELDAKLTILLMNQRQTDGVITRMALAIDEIRQVQGKPPKFGDLHSPPPISQVAVPTKEELERVQLLQQVNQTLAAVNEQLKKLKQK